MRRGPAPSATAILDGGPLLDRLAAVTARALDACRCEDTDRLMQAIGERASAAADLERFFVAARQALTAGTAPGAEDPALATVVQRLRDADHQGRELEEAVRARRDELARRLAAARRDRTAMQSYLGAEPARRPRLDRRF